jgi:predicted GNAT family N-acyltransferase
MAPKGGPYASENLHATLHIRFFLSSHRSFILIVEKGQGIGTRLLLHSISVTRSELNGTVLWCDARETTQVWYERRGMAAFGSNFYKGPVKYVRMKIDIEQRNVPV